MKHTTATIFEAGRADRLAGRSNHQPSHWKNSAPWRLPANADLVYQRGWIAGSAPRSGEGFKGAMVYRTIQAHTKRPADDSGLWHQCGQASTRQGLSRLLDRVREQQAATGFCVRVENL